jgi:hypothetical protein
MTLFPVRSRNTSRRQTNWTSDLRTCFNAQQLSDLNLGSSYSTAAATLNRRLMKTTRTQTLFALLVVAGVVALTFPLGPASALASSARSGRLHITKECSEKPGFPAPSARSHSRTSQQSPSARRSSMTRRVILCQACSTATSSSTRGTAIARSAVAHSMRRPPSEYARSRTGSET